MRFGVALTFVASAATLLNGQQPAPRPVARAAGYLSAAETPDVKLIVPPPPEEGDSRFANDMAIFHATRTLEGSPRWALAVADDELTVPALLRDFSCALGVVATAENAPLTTRLLTRARVDANRASNALKNFYGHKRPFQIAEGNVCVTPAGRARLERNADYPSGHTATSWETALVLSELAPDAATGILARARAFGQSRVVCGVHNASAVEAGWMTSTAVFAAQQASAEFRADVDAARAELAALRQSATVDGAACAAQASLISQAPY
jgi:acid phosphatase (class A)